MKYQILIDGTLYESSNNQAEALYLYDTVDDTCLHQYFGHVKTLISDGKEIKSDRIKNKQLWQDL